MSARRVSTTIRDAQQALLWSLTAAVSFTAKLHGSQLRVRWSPALRTLFGLTVTQAAPGGGPLYHAWVSHEDREPIQRACVALSAAHTPIDLTYCVQLPQDGRKYLHLMAQTYDAANGQVIGVLQDCTHSMTAERSLQASQQRLQSLGRLTLLGEVAAGLAHELNQPLAAIATFAQAGERLLALPEPRLEKAQQVFKEVSQQALRAGDIIRHMRSLIKRHALQRERFSVTNLARDFLQLAEPMARGHRVELVTQLTLAERFIDVDVTQIHQVLMILFQNALDAVKHLAGEPAVVTVVMKTESQSVLIAVEDNGSGIDSAAAAQLFQPFFSTKENGTGLGLVSARNILDAYGSRLEFNNLAQGCRFSFVLPLVSTDVAHAVSSVKGLPQ